MRPSGNSYSVLWIWTSESANIIIHFSFLDKIARNINHSELIKILLFFQLLGVYVRRFQVNVGFNRLLRDTIPDFDYLHEDLIYLPVIWVEMKYELPAMMGGKPVAFITFILRAVIPRLWIFFMIISFIFLAIPTVQRYRKRRNHLKTSINSSNQDFDAVDNSLLDLGENRSTTL